MKRVLYIAGTRRTGSTLLDILLGSVSGLCSTGQLAYFRKPGRDECACERTLSDCPVWSKVLAFPHLPDERAFRRMQEMVDNEKGFPSFLLSKARRRAYASVYDRLYQAVFEATGADVVVDSSKNMSRALALLQSSRYELHVLHVVRDPRGLIDSIHRMKDRNNEPKPSRLRLMTEWTIKHSMASFALKPLAGSQYCRLHYEDLLLHPRQAFDQISQLIGRDLSGIVERIQNGEPFARRHIFAGNGISRKESITFDPSYINQNRWSSRENDAFWYTIGWPAAFWGYTRDQSYLKSAPAPSAEPTHASG